MGGPMGAWGPGTFDNDAACDWAGALAQTDGLEVIEAALDEVHDAGDALLDSDVAAEAIAAADVIACLRGDWGPRGGYSETTAAWIEARKPPPPELVQRAVAALDRIVGPGSELAELWDEDPDWHAAVADVRRRLVT